ncbi:MAG: sigma-70 family RNA polymerase sigma factor [Planctomycetes bacterium]|nr:sigma-70 family RNA polymerase sigma factor [Planctomycetota bacterium]
MSDFDLTRTLDLVRKFQQDRDADALNRLFARYGPRILGIVRIRLGPKLRTRLESMDIVQDTFATALRKFDDFEMRDEASFIHWLSTIAEHQITDRRDYHEAKKRSASRETSLDGDRPDALPALEPVSDVDSPLDALIRTEGSTRVEEKIAELPDKYRELILLRDYAGFSWKEVAERADRPTPDAAREMHRQAIVKLARAMLEGETGA